MAPKDARQQRHEAMLDAALDVLQRDATAGLASVLSVEKVAREARLPGTARRDWEGSRGVGLLLALAEERLNRVDQDGIGELADTAMGGYPSTKDADVVPWFVESMVAYNDAALERSTTAPGLLLAAAAAAGSQLGDGEGPSNALAERLMDARRHYYEALVETYTGLMGQVLTNMGRRLIADVDTSTMIHLLQALHEGCLLRRFIDPDVFGEGGRVVAQAQLAIIEAFSEPVALSAGDLADPGRWVAEVAPSAALACRQDRLTAVEVIAELRARSAGALGSNEIEELLRSAYPTDADLWDVTLRWRLTPVAATLQVRGIRSDAAILHLVFQRIQDVNATHPGLAAAVLSVDGPSKGDYTTSLGASVADLLQSLDAPDAPVLAPHLVELALAGNGDTISSLLRAIGLVEDPTGRT